MAELAKESNGIFRIALGRIATRTRGFRCAYYVGRKLCVLTSAKHYALVEILKALPDESRADLRITVWSAG